MFDRYVFVGPESYILSFGGAGCLGLDNQGDQVDKLITPQKFNMSPEKGLFH